MPLNFIIALTFSLLYLLRRYITDKDVIYFPLYIGTILSWISTITNNTYYYIAACVVFIVSIIASFFLYEEEPKKDDAKQNDNLNYIDAFKGVNGRVVSVMQNGKSYLGAICTNGKLDEIIVYSEDKMEIGDVFTILGIFSGKIMANKL